MIESSNRRIVEWIVEWINGRIVESRRIVNWYNMVLIVESSIFRIVELSSRQIVESSSR